MNETNVITFDLANTVPNGAPVFTQSARNEEVPPHRHSYIEFFYVFGGEGEQELNGVSKTLHRGEACLLLPNDIHLFHETKNGVFLRRDILISIAFFKEICDFFSSDLFKMVMDGKYSRHLVLSSEEIASIEGYVPSLFLDPESQAYSLAAKLLVTYLLNIIIAWSIKQTASSIPDWLSNLATRLSTYDNFKCALPSLIVDLAFTPDYIRRMFKKYYGMTMTDYFNKQKINYAYFLLKKTDCSIEEICEALGFQNISYFYKLFKKIVHITPNRIRKENEAD